MLKNILSGLGSDASISYGKEREVNNVAIVVVTSNRGLCGAFNTNIIKAAIAEIEDNYAHLLASGNVKIYSIGKKGGDVLRRKYGKEVVDTTYVNLFSDLSYANVSTSSLFLMDGFSKGQFDKVVVCYGQFKNAAVQEPTAVQYLPVQKIDEFDIASATKSKPDYVFEPSKEELLEELVPTILQTTFHKFLLDTHASEHGARMTAMDKATENAEEMIKSLKVNYNKARQEAITRELSEIVAGAAAL